MKRQGDVGSHKDAEVCTISNVVYVAYCIVHHSYVSCPNMMVCYKDDNMIGGSPVNRADTEW